MIKLLGNNGYDKDFGVGLCLWETKHVQGDLYPQLEFHSKTELAGPHELQMTLTRIFRGSMDDITKHYLPSNMYLLLEYIWDISIICSQDCIRTLPYSRRLTLQVMYPNIYRPRPQCNTIHQLHQSYYSTPVCTENGVLLCPWKFVEGISYV